jgi:hypothetical protein
LKVGRCAIRALNATASPRLNARSTLRTRVRTSSREHTSEEAVAARGEGGAPRARVIAAAASRRTTSTTLRLRRQVSSRPRGPKRDASRVSADSSQSGDRFVRRQRKRRPPCPPADQGAAIRPPERLGRHSAAREGRERLPRIPLVGGIRKLAPRADRRRCGRHEGEIRVRLRRLPPAAPDRSHRVRLPSGGVATQRRRAGRT